MGAATLDLDATDAWLGRPVTAFGLFVLAMTVHMVLLDATDITKRQLSRVVSHEQTWTVWKMQLQRCDAGHSALPRLSHPNFPLLAKKSGPEVAAVHIT